nr:GtrA family protein [Xanthomonas albilineans]
MPSKQFVLFLIAGGLAAVVNFGSRIVLSHWLRYVPAIFIAYCFGMITAFLLNRFFVFSNAGNRLYQQIIWFVAINSIAVAQTILVSLLLVHHLLPAMHVEFHNETIAHAIGVAIPVITSYIGHKHLSFSSIKSKNKGHQG